MAQQLQWILYDVRMFCTLTDDFDAATVGRIQARLNEVELKHGVRVVWAVESGSRAWGFPSPDSDYDCRFFYIRPYDDYVSPWRPRDVIETPLDDILDVNGWDLIKAIRLGAKSNATVLEWLRSPLIYRGQPEFAEELLDLCKGLVNYDAVRNHYFHTGRYAWDRSGATNGEVISLKKLFYAIRPAAALQWMRLHGSAVPPMNLAALLDEAPPAPDVLEAITALVEAKSVTRELGKGIAPEPIRRFIQHEFQLAAETESGPRHPAAEARAQASQVFIDLVRRFAPHANVPAT